jgi:hypothetical protein
VKRLSSDRKMPFVRTTRSGRSAFEIANYSPKYNAYPVQISIPAMVSSLRSTEADIPAKTSCKISRNSLIGKHRVAREKYLQFSVIFSLSNLLLVQHKILEVSVVTQVIPCSVIVVSILHQGSCLLPLENCHAMN